MSGLDLAAEQLDVREAGVILPSEVALSRVDTGLEATDSSLGWAVRPR